MRVRSQHLLNYTLWVALVLAMIGLFVSVERLSAADAGRDYRLTDVHGKVVKAVLA